MRFVLLLLLAFPAYAQAPSFTPEELMGERKIKPPDCKDGVCAVAEDDLMFMLQRNKLMEQVANELYRRLQGCRGERGV